VIRLGSLESARGPGEELDDEGAKDLCGRGQIGFASLDKRNVPARASSRDLDAAHPPRVGQTVDRELEAPHRKVHQSQVDLAGRDLLFHLPSGHLPPAPAGIAAE
jgi:hypothetical protein